MTVLLELDTLPPQGAVTLKVEYSFDIKITAQQARRQVDRWLLNQVSYLMGAGEPMLVVAHQVVWRVPVYLSTPDFGQFGPLGIVEVMVNDGTMSTTAQLKADIIYQAEKRVKLLPPYRLRQSSPLDYLAPNVAPRLIVTEQGEIVPISLAEA